ncbi:MAG: hypothetical protein JXR97_13235 [Planctomycetes bacterium]|nr:hypothetical protein [Planctomycetota bacterium]
MLSNMKFLGHSEGVELEESSMMRKYHHHHHYHKAHLHPAKSGMMMSIQHHMSKSRIREPQGIDDINEVKAMEELGFLLAIDKMT